MTETPGRAAIAPAQSVTAGDTTTRYEVSGMDCASCAQKIDTAVRRVPGVRDVSVSAAAGKLTVAHEPTLPSAAVEQQVKRLGYGIVRAADTGAERRRAHFDEEGDSPWWRGRKAILTAACGLALVAAYLVGLIVPATEGWAFLLAISVGLIPVARRAIMGALAGSPFTIETLMTVAAVGAVIIGETEEAAIVVLLFLVGELLEGVAAGRARASIRGLARLVPKTALLEREEGRTEQVPAETLAVGSTILGFTMRSISRLYSVWVRSFDLVSTCSATNRSARALIVGPERSFCFLSAGSLPSATRPRMRLASRRASSGLQGEPCLPMVNQR